MRSLKENNRKRIKNLRRRVYDSLNVFLACNIFVKDRKKVTLNMDFYEYLPAEFKDLVDGKVTEKPVPVEKEEPEPVPVPVP